MSRSFNFNFNPFRGCSHDELVLAYTYMADCGDSEGCALVADAYDEDVWIDLTAFGISTSDHP